jgi:hypothetical protein
MMSTAFSVGSNNPHRRQCRPLFLSSSTTTDGSNNPSSLLEGKLLILQDVVKELHRRQQTAQQLEQETNQETKVRITNLQNELETSQQKIQKQSIELEELHKQLLTMKDVHATELSRLTTEKDRQYQQQTVDLQQQSTEQIEEIKQTYDQQIATLQTQIKSKEKELDSLTSQMKIQMLRDQKEIDSLRSKLTVAQDAASRIQQEEDIVQRDRSIEVQKKDETILELTGQLRALQAKLERTVHDYKHQIQDLSNENRSLLSRLEEIAQRNDEQMEIATAAVKAAESRERRAQLELEAVEKQCKQRTVQVKIQKLAMDGMIQEQSDLEEEADRWKEAHDHAQRRIQELEEELRRRMNKNNNNNSDNHDKDRRRGLRRFFLSRK